MSKRVAEKQLTDQNWQEEEEEEEMGEFKKAPDEVIKTRVIKTAKRRVANGSNGEKPSAFSGFAGFGSQSSTPSFGATSTTNGSAAKPAFSFGASPANSSNPFTTPSAAPSTAPSTVAPSDDVFLKKLKKLNNTVLKFAQEHVEKNPFVILTSVFNDYEKHLARIQESTKADSSSVGTPREADSTKPDPPAEKEPVSSASEEKKQETKPFSFGAASAPFSFGEGGSTGFSFKPTSSAADSTQSGSGGFSFKPTTPAVSSLFGKPAATSFTGFGGLAKPAADSSEDKKEEEEDETPPVPEKVEHVEKEALYHIKCKLFLKSGDGWNEKGVGIANLKECEGKVQLLIRNDTTMGTVILNTLLHDKLPITKSGKNGLMIVATTEDSKTETYLCRVNKDKVDEFHDKLEEYKKGITPTTTTEETQ